MPETPHRMMMKMMMALVYGAGGGGGAGGSWIQRKTRLETSKSKTPVLDNFGRDLTKLAEEDKLDPIVGRGERN